MQTMNSQKDKEFLFKSAMYNILGTVLKVAGPLLAILTARIFGKESFGLFVSTQLWILTLSRISVLGLDKGLQWFLPQNSVQNRPVHYGYNETIIRSITIALCIFFTLIFCAGFELHKYAKSLEILSRAEIVIYALSLLPWVLLHIYGGASEGMRKPQYKIFITDCSVAAMAPLIAIALYFFGIPYALPIGLLSANILGCIFYLPLVKKLFPGNPGLSLEKVPKELLLYSLPRGFSEVIASILYRVDLWLVLLLLGPGEAGVYSVMLTVANALRTVANSFGPILLPVVAGMNEERLKNDLKPTFSYCVGMTSCIQLVIGFFIVMFPEEILSIAGKSFIVQPEALGILLLANVSFGLFGMVGIVISGLGKSFHMMKVDIISLCTAFVANYFLIPIFGLVGAAISTFIFALTQVTLNNIYLFKLGFFPYTKKLLINIGLTVALAVFFIIKHWQV